MTTPVSLPHGTNLVGLPTGLIASVGFNDQPAPLHISGVREMNDPLFEMLAKAENMADASDAFLKYMVAVYGLDFAQKSDDCGIRRPFRSSFLRLLIGWGYDSSSREAAVLKGWVESRFGLLPGFHHDPIGTIGDASFLTYVEERMESDFHTNSIFSQLDLLYEYVQWVLAYLVYPDESHVHLYRGVDGFHEHHIVNHLDRHHFILRLNSLCSFTTDRWVADCFGHTILTVDVPLSKILFANTLLTFFPLRSEREFWVIGGDYRVSVERD
ncbi:NAD(+)--dinitrogen-reductase ADP-D-ribosyltransferase [Pleomorphomonas sp. PLEO]|uniref:NAD(+)--dinitrogen-reductase ADP-D-ribosyltransferase n=1 Tax=Pleomorphomonas sp. PLEO TaxID=3239306 RepID=UPI00351DFF00